MAVALAVALLASGAAGADGYVVQIGAFRHPSAAFGADAEPFGSVSTRQTRSGLTLFEVGPFESPGQAREALRGLQAAGYADAFVHRARTAAASRSGDLPPVGAGPPPDPAARFEKLPPELKGRVVYLDGELHVKEGDRFVPLDQFEGGRYR